MKYKTITFIIVLILGLAIGTYKMTGNSIQSENTKVLLKTNMGDIVIELYKEKAPITVENFIQYVEEGHYDGTIFHRVIKGFMIQGGGFDKQGNEKPTHAPIKLESDNGLSNVKGSIAMARTMVPDSATSQFFINVADNNMLDYSPGNPGYAVFGKVIEGMDVVDKIKEVKTGNKAMHQDWPVEDVEIIKVSII